MKLENDSYGAFFNKQEKAKLRALLYFASNGCFVGFIKAQKSKASSIFVRYMRYRGVSRNLKFPGASNHFSSILG